MRDENSVINELSTGSGACNGSQWSDSWSEPLPSAILLRTGGCLSPQRSRTNPVQALESSHPTSPLAVELSTTRLGHRFGQRVLFRKMDARFRGGTTTAITGSNGSGKSTLVRILAGLMHPTKGNVELLVDGSPVHDEVRPMHCGMVAPYLNVYDGFSPRENLQFLASVRGMGKKNPRIDAVLEQVQMIERADDPVSTFSSGMIQRVRLACALLSDPPVLLLDEPTATLDLAGVAIVRDIIDSAVSRARVVIVATNEPDEAAACEYRIDIGDFR